MSVVVYEPHLRGHRGEYVEHILQAAAERCFPARHVAELPSRGRIESEWVVVPDGEANLRALPMIRRRLRGKVFMLSMRGAPWPRSTAKRRVNRAVFQSLSASRVIDSYGVLWPHWVPAPPGKAWVVDPVPDTSDATSREALAAAAALDTNSSWLVGLGDAADPRKNAKGLAEAALQLPSRWESVWVGGAQPPPAPLSWIPGPVSEPMFSSFVANAAVVFAAYTVAQPSGLVARSLDRAVPVVTCVPVPPRNGIEVAVDSVAEPIEIARAIQAAARLRPQPVPGPRGLDFGRRILDLAGARP